MRVWSALGEIEGLKVACASSQCIEGGTAGIAHPPIARFRCEREPKPFRVVTDRTLIKKSKSSPDGQPPPTRRKPEAAESEILNAAENFLKEFPFREMTVDDIMARTGLSRPSFYEYFRDRSHLIVKLIERLNERDRAVSARWFTDPDPVESLRHTIRDLVQAYISQGHLLRALSDATHVYENVEASYRERFEVVIRETGRRIGEFMARGVVSLRGRGSSGKSAARAAVDERALHDREVRPRAARRSQGCHRHPGRDLVAGASWSSAVAFRGNLAISFQSAKTYFE